MTGRKSGKDERHTNSGRQPLYLIGTKITVTMKLKFKLVASHHHKISFMDFVVHNYCYTLNGPLFPYLHTVENNAGALAHQINSTYEMAA